MTVKHDLTFIDTQFHYILRKRTANGNLPTISFLQVDVPQFEFGDTVRVVDDIVTVHNLQTGHGEWNDDIVLVGPEPCACFHTYAGSSSCVIRRCETCS